MSLQRKIKERRNRRALRVRSGLSTDGLPRVTVFRSLKHIYAQLIDTTNSTTLASCSTLELDTVSGDKTEQAKAVGKELARKALEKGIKQAQLDRGRFLYHGRVQALAEGLRESGLSI